MTAAAVCSMAIAGAALAVLCVAGGCGLAVLLYLRQRLVDRLRGMLLEKWYPENVEKTDTPEGTTKK